MLCTACESTEDRGRRLPTDAEVEAYNASVPPEDRIVCRDEVPTGSRIPRRVCRLVGDIQATADFSQEVLRRMITR